MFISKFLVHNILPPCTNLIKGSKHEVAAKFTNHVISHTPIAHTPIHISIRNHIRDNNPHQILNVNKENNPEWIIKEASPQS